MRRRRPSIHPDDAIAIDPIIPPLYIKLQLK